MFKVCFFSGPLSVCGASAAFGRLSNVQKECFFIMPIQRCMPMRQSLCDHLTAQKVDKDSSGGIDQLEMRKLFQSLGIVLPDPGIFCRLCALFAMFPGWSCFTTLM